MRNQQSDRRVVSEAIRIHATKSLLATFVAALGLAVSLLATPAQAVSYTWTNSAGGNWLTDGNWNTTGAPDDAGDTATLGNVSGPYTVTLGSATTIGGLTISGTHPTVTLNSALTISGGTSNISGGVINGTSSLRLINNAAVNWTGGALGGTASILLPTLQNATINNSVGAFSLGSGQSVRLGDVANGTPSFSTLTFANGFSNSGEIRLGMPQPGDNFGRFQIFVNNNGTIVNNAAGTVNLFARSPTEPSATWNHREIQANIQNAGTIRSFTSTGLLGGAGKTVTNTGSIITDYSTYSTTTAIPSITISGTSFTNSGILDIGANHGGKGGGRITILSDTIDLNSGSTINGPGTLVLGGNTVNVNAGTTFNGISVLGFGRNNASTTVNWNIADLTTATTFRMDAGGNITFNRTGAWNIPTNQILEFATPSSPANVPMSLNMSEDINNSGLVRMGLPQPGDNFVQANLNLSGTKTFTNNVNGTVEMWPRGPASGNDPTWNIRNINANVVNDGLINDFASNARLGTTGKTVINNGTININSSFFTGGGRAMLQFAGDSGTNAAGGTINLTSSMLWINTPTFNYDGGSITATGNSEIILGSGPINSTFNFNGGAEITDPVTWVLRPSAEGTINRSSTWNILSGGGLRMEGGSDSSSQTGLTINQDISNSGLIQLGMPTGDSFLNQRLVFTNTNSRLTNNANGTIVMYPRSNSSTDDTAWSQRRIEGELINDGQFTIATRFGNLGKAVAGIDHVNNGTITFDRSIYESGPLGANPLFTPTLFVTGSSLLNGANGVINGNGILNVTALPGSTFNNAGTLSPGLSAGILTVQGNVNFQSGGELLIEITGENGVVGVDYDRLIVSGAVTNLSLANLVVDISSLDLDLVGDVFTIVTANTDFTGMHFGSVTFTGPGMFKGDVIFGNGFIQLANIESFVPEPSSGCLLLLGLIALRKRNRRNARS